MIQLHMVQNSIKIVIYITQNEIVWPTMPVLKHLTTTLARNWNKTDTFIQLIFLRAEGICLETLWLAVLAFHFLSFGYLLRIHLPNLKCNKKKKVIFLSLSYAMLLSNPFNFFNILCKYFFCLFYFFWWWWRLS